jgi:hypothetical protein
MAVRSKRLYQEARESQIEKVSVNNQGYRRLARKYAWEYLETHPCTSCGETVPIVLEFHHVRGTKLDEVSRLIGRVRQFQPSEPKLLNVMCFALTVIAV